MQLGDAQCLGGQVNPQRIRTLAGKRIGQDAATAAQVQCFEASHRCDAVDPLQAQGVDLVQGAKLAVLVPPAVGKLGKLG
jgi:hypothetical protein